MALYVDDFLGMQDAQVVEMTLPVILAFCSAFGIPLSWHKLQLGFCISWIGWSINFKLDKLFSFCRLFGELTATGPIFTKCARSYAMASSGLPSC